MAVIRQMTLDECLTPQVSQRVTRGNQVKDAILKAMQAAAAEEQQYQVRIFPMYPHDVLVYLEEEYWRHISNIRRHMAAMAERGMIKRLGQRKGYCLDEGHVNPLARGFFIAAWVRVMQRVKGVGW